VSSVMDIAVAWIVSFEAETIGSRESMMSGWFKEIIIIKKMRRGEKCFILLELLRSLLRLLSCFPEFAVRCGVGWGVCCCCCWILNTEYFWVLCRLFFLLIPVFCCALPPSFDLRWQLPSFRDLV